MLAVDPTSPFSGGAILGDRVRMQDHATDPGVFIRSMATRGHLGGLAVATPQAVRVLDAVGTPWIIVETVGVGQVEVEIAGHADTTVVVVNPGWGDAVQAAKAGLLEIADVFVVNKADRPGAPETVRDLEGMLELAGDTGWRPPVVLHHRDHRRGHRRAVGRDRRAPRAPRSDGRRRRSAGASACVPRSARSSRNGCSNARPARHAGDGFDALLDEVVARGPQSLRRRRRVVRRWVTRTRIRWRTCSRPRRPVGSPIPTVASTCFPSSRARPTGCSGSPRTSRSRPPIPREEVLARVPPGNFSFPMSAPFVTWIAERIGARPGVLDAVLCARGRGIGAPPWLVPEPDADHPRVRAGPALPPRRHCAAPGHR